MSAYPNVSSGRSAIYRIFQGSILAVLLVILLRIFVFDSSIVKGDSMAPNLLSGDYIFIDKLAYRSHAPQAGDVIVGTFRGSRLRVIKRIIAVPPQWVTITPTTVYIQNGREGTSTELTEPYIELPGYATNGATTAYRLDPNEYFVLGDNRAVSEDSRDFGPIDKFSVAGKVVARFRYSDMSLLLL